MSLFRDIVAANHHESDGVLVAAREPCITIAYDEKANVAGRAFRVVTPSRLSGLALRPSWLMAVLLCPGDDTSGLATWAAGGSHDPRRILFYLHPDTDARHALAAWHAASLPITSAWTVADWKALHKHFGAHWNVRVYDDFRHR